MMEAPRVEILGKLEADRIFDFLANPVLETPPPSHQYSRDPPLEYGVGWKKGFPTCREFQGRWDDGVEPISGTVWRLFWTHTLPQDLLSNFGPENTAFFFT